MKRVHATSVAVEGRGVLLRGESGAGKSDLALRLIDQGAVLIADDYTELSIEDDCLIAHAPETIQGLLEVRGLGIVKQPFHSPCPIALVVDLRPQATIERLPEHHTCDDFGPAVAWMEVAPFEASSPAKIRLSLQAEVQS